VYAPFTAAWNQYVRAELKWESDLPYEILTGRVHPWSWGDYDNRYVNVSESLRAAMTQNRDLKVFVANGHYDLATPFFATEYTFDHLGLDPTLRNHVSMDFFEAGHMMYTPALDKPAKFAGEG
jgi:carboxypeptidase C (cathepsin A)